MAIFVKGKKALTDTLFSPINGKTADGYYTVKPDGVLIHAANGDPRVFIVDRTPDKPRSAWAVTVHAHNGRVRYMHALCSADERFAGFPDGYAARIEHANKLAALAREGSTVDTATL